jgi:hypothetical protein
VTIPGPSGFWATVFCGIGLHKRRFAFGWTEYLDGSESPAYTGTFYCERCGRVFNQARPAAAKKEGREG